MAEQTIWRYMEQVDWRITLRLPGDAEVLTVRAARGDGAAIEVWARHVPAVDGVELHPRELVVVGTGWDVPPDAGRFIGSTFHRDGTFVFHIFEVRRG